MFSEEDAAELRVWGETATGQTVLERWAGWYTIGISNSHRDADECRGALCASAERMGKRGRERARDPGIRMQPPCLWALCLLSAGEVG